MRGDNILECLTRYFASNFPGKGVCLVHCALAEISRERSVVIQTGQSGELTWNRTGADPLLTGSTESLFKLCTKFFSFCFLFQLELGTIAGLA